MAGPVARPPGESRDSRGLALAVLCAATLMVILDGTIVTVALPSIQRDLGFSAPSLTWVMNAYMLAFGGLLLLAGRLGDLIGRRRMFLSGLAVFTAASLACGLAAGPQFLVAARFVQGAGAAMVSAVSLGMIVGLYSEQRDRVRALAAFSFVGAAAIACGRRLLSADRGAGLAEGADALGAALVTAGLMAGSYALVGTAQDGWGSARTLGFAATAVVLLGAFVVRQATAARPLLRLTVFRSRAVSGANLAQALVIAAAFGFQVLIALYLQRVLGYTPAEAGLGILPTALVIGAVSLGLAARLAARFGERAVLLAGLALVVAALVLLTQVPVTGGYGARLLPALVIFGLGGGLTLPMLATLGMSASTPADAGVVSGLFNTTQQIGAAVGVALLSTLAASQTAQLRHHDVAVAAALTSGYRLAFAVGAGLSAAALIVAATVLRTRPASPAPARSVGDDNAVPVSQCR